MNETSLAAALLARRDAASPAPLPASDTPVADLDAAYRLQAATAGLREARGERRIGYKIGVTSAAARAMLGISHPFFGRLFASTTHASPARVAFLPILHTVYEPEIALRLGADLPPGPATAETLRAATAAVLPCIELVATCFTPWAEAGAPRLVADNAAHGHWITGPETTDFAGLDLMEAPVSLMIDGDTVATGKPSLVDGGPFAAAAWLANALAAQGTPLRAGDYITTGTTTQPMPIRGGQHTVARFEGLGSVGVDIL